MKGRPPFPLKPHSMVTVEPQSSPHFLGVGSHGGARSFQANWALVSHELGELMPWPGDLCQALDFCGWLGDLYPLPSGKVLLPSNSQSQHKGKGARSCPWSKPEGISA